MVQNEDSRTHFPFTSTKEPVNGFACVSQWSTTLLGVCFALSLAGLKLVAILPPLLQQS